MCRIDEIKEHIRAKAIELGFDACGFAKAAQVNNLAAMQYDNWIKYGKHDCMDYAEKYMELRRNPCELQPGAKTIICVAINYFPETFQDSNHPQFAFYSYGKDYHDVVRNKLKLLTLYLQENYSAESRICVDTAPIMEKYWAKQAGIGMIGRNNLLIIPGKGSYFFLGELITTLELTPDLPCDLTCGDCGKCIEACPGGALNDNTLDARRCLSCQLIERRGELPEWINDVIENRLYGCDECQKCCPHNKNAQHADISDFAPNEQQLSLTLDDIQSMTADRFREIFCKSAVKRTKLEGLKRNAEIISRNMKKIK